MEYRPIFLGILFTTIYLKYNPRFALENADSGQTRISKILGLIQESKFGIHDLSRMVSNDKDEYYRMNMPFELGIDYACQNINQKIFPNKKILILDCEQYRYKIGLSDLSGCDIEKHDNDEIKAIVCVRDWLVKVDQLFKVCSGNAIWSAYNEFYAYLDDELITKAKHLSIDAVDICEITTYMRDWVNKKHLSFDVKN